MFDPITTIDSKFVIVDGDEIDTDRIIPARFLTTTRRDGLGAALFCDWRASNAHLDAALREASECRAAILIAGAGFGSGSSREHAVWALHDFGIRAILAISFADIFKANAVQNGLVPVTLDRETHAAIRALGDASLRVDLERLALAHRERVLARIELDPRDAECLRKGIDELGWILSQTAAIDRYEEITP